MQSESIYSVSAPAEEGRKSALWDGDKTTHAHKHSQPQSVLATSLLNKHTWGWWWCDDFLNVENPPCSIFSQMLWLQSCTHFSVQFLSSNLNFYFENEMAEYLCHFSMPKMWPSRNGFTFFFLLDFCIMAPINVPCSYQINQNILNMLNTGLCCIWSLRSEYKT